MNNYFCKVFIAIFVFLFQQSLALFPRPDVTSTEKKRNIPIALSQVKTWQKFEPFPTLFKNKTISLTEMYIYILYVTVVVKWNL